MYYRRKIASQISKRHLSVWNIWTFFRRFSRNLTPRETKKNTLTVFVFVSNKLDTYLTSLWRHERYLFSVFRGIMPAIFGRFSKKLSTSRAPEKYFTVTCRHTIVFYGKGCFSNIKTSSKRLEYLNIFTSFFKKFNTSWNQKKYFNSICVLFILIIW
jgi:hypothetical protein